MCPSNFGSNRLYHQGIALQCLVLHVASIEASSPTIDHHPHVCAADFLFYFATALMASVVWPSGRRAGGPGFHKCDRYRNYCRTVLYVWKKLL
jgi:hypothetical protein